jgi:hypothetical protein
MSVDLHAATAEMLSAYAYAAFALGRRHAIAGERALPSKRMMLVLFPSGWSGSDSYRFKLRQVYKAGFDLGVMRARGDDFA